MRVCLLGIIVPRFWLSDVSAKFSCLYCIKFLTCSFSCFICSFYCFSWFIFFFISCISSFKSWIVMMFWVFLNLVKISSIQYCVGQIYWVLFGVSVRIKIFKFCNIFFLSPHIYFVYDIKKICLSTFEEITFIILFLFLYLFIYVELLFSILFVSSFSNFDILPILTFSLFSMFWIILSINLFVDVDVCPITLMSLFFSFICFSSHVTIFYFLTFVTTCFTFNYLFWCFLYLFLHLSRRRK